jgi:two-component system sensor histidine kinase YesM
MSAYPNILEVGVYTDNPTIESGGNYFVINRSVRNSPWLMRHEQLRGGMTTVAYFDNSGIAPGKRISVVSELDAFPGLDTYRKVLRIDLNVNKIYGILNREIGSLHLLLVDGQNRLVASGDGIQEQNAPISAYNPPAGTPGSVMEKTIGNANYIKGWKLVGMADTRRIDSMISDAKRSILLLAAISTVLPSLLIFVILRSYHYRVKKLSRHMEKVRNEKFDLIELQEGRDEIGGLIRTFNLMTGKINELFNDVYKLEIRQKNLELERIRAEMNMLQSQMNPHFLFNTLNALLVVCAKNGYTEAMGMIQNLSLLLRRLMSWSDDLVPVQEELHFTEMYLQIEKFRFGDRFDYSIEIDPEASGCRIPKMSIQTLVENACKHGLQSIQAGGIIRIKALISDRKLAVTVADNGIGMEEEQLRGLIEAVRSDREMRGHVGIRNVYRRLELFYHESAGFRLESEPSLGTTVGFTIPLHRLHTPGEDKANPNANRPSA